MRVKRFILLLISVFYACCSSAQIKGEYVQSRILILLDESSSMIQPWASGKEKYKAARELIMRLMDSVYAVNSQVEFGLRVFGHQHTVPENDCYDTRNEVPFSIDNRNQMSLRLEDIHPLGVTPIAFALSEAANKDIIDENHNAYSIVLITDGGESCGGDICEVMKKLLKSKVFFKPYIVSLENDPTLKTTYACMGDFLQVTREGDIPKAVMTIVEAFRPVLRMTKTDYKEIQTSNIPSVLKVTIPTKTWTVPAVDVFPEIKAVAPKPFAINPPIQKTLAPTGSSVHLPAVVKEVPELPKPVTIAAINTAGVRPLSIANPEAGKIKAVKFSPKLPPVVIDTPIAPKTEKIAKLKPVPLRQFNVIFVIEEHTYSTRPVPPLPAVKPEKGIAVKPEPEKKQDYKVETTDDKETSIEVYFTNGAGKYYTTTPQVLLLDPATKQVVKKFYRTVDPNGNPDPQTGIPPGVYDLTFATNRNFVLAGVNVELNKKKKIIVTVKSTTLSFAYKEPPNTAIKEGWIATVTERNKVQGRVQDQKMNEAMTYEPGNYHIEINTFPRTYRNEDLDFAFESVITISHPGIAKFVATDSRTHSVTLYQQIGDKFLSFTSIELNDPRSQHLTIQPGEYQAHYQSGPGQSSAAEKVVVFRIKPNEETTVELK
jgi:hypothetical protein